ncbi:hypothetical protein NDA18_005708 [Ustilago nuda]|nr:hypothetical protein NDA18_005708 [Ustilago nuda]
MSRRLVSYSDLTEDCPPPPQSTATEGGTEASCSYKTHPQSSGKKRKKGQHQKHANSKDPVRSRGNGLHRDDPSYNPSSSAGFDEGPHLRGIAANGDEEEMEGEEYYDATDGGEEDNRSLNGNGEGEEEGSFIGWKYDEYAEPYDRSHRHYTGLHPSDYVANTSASVEPDPEDADEDSKNQERDAYVKGHDSVEDEEEEEEDLLPNFAIPDVAEFDRLWAAKTLPCQTFITSNTLPSASAHAVRPPIEVGGGGRPLSHTEIWSDSTLTSAFNAALHQYCHLHNLHWSGEEAKSALWTDAPLHNSLLATQVREDTEQILAQRKQISTKPDAVQGGKKKGKNEAEEQKMQSVRRRKEIVTIVPSAHLEGNTAWKKAVKTVQTTPNSVGVKEGEEREKELNGWWIAGYYAGLAAAGVAAGGSGEKANEERKIEEEHIDTR